MIPQEPASREALPRDPRFRRNFWAFIGVTAAVIVLNVGLDAGMPLFWPLAAWSVVVAIHYFIASAADVDEEWVDDRATEIRMRSYDFGHIGEIKQRAAEREDALTHRLERDEPPNKP